MTSPPSQVGAEIEMATPGSFHERYVPNPVMKALSASQGSLISRNTPSGFPLSTRALVVPSAPPAPSFPPGLGSLVTFSGTASFITLNILITSSPHTLPHGLPLSCSIALATHRHVLCLLTSSMESETLPALFSVILPNS